MSEPEKKEGKIIIEIELPTKETVIKKLSELFPGIRVTIKEEPKTPLEALKEQNKENE